MQKMARRKTPRTVETLTHEEASRKNIPTAEFRSVMDRSEQSPVQVAYERRNRDLDPQLVWRGKDAQDWSDLVVQAPPLFIQEKVHPKVLIDDLRRQSANAQAGQGGDGAEVQPDLFADFNGLPSDDARTEFYQHDANWSNRMILGDSDLRMNAGDGVLDLAEREGPARQGAVHLPRPALRHQVQLGELPVVDDQRCARRQGRQGGAHQPPEPEQVEGVPGYLAGTRWPMRRIRI